jgi:uncharacterized membrane protein
MMLTKTRNFIKTTLLGGIIVILPTTIFFFAINWLFAFVSRAIRPLTDLVEMHITLPAPIAKIMVIIIIIITCFFVGLFVRTKLGKMVYDSIEVSLLSRAPGYKVIKETVNQFLGKKKTPFASVALVRIFENHTLATAFITDEHEDGSFTVFVPTGPNPTSGQIFHLQAAYVHPVAVSVEEAMRSIISCGAGSDGLIKALRNQHRL